MQVMVSLALLVQVLNAICLVLYVFKLFPKYLNSSILLGSAAVMLFAWPSSTLHRLRAGFRLSSVPPPPSVANLGQYCERKYK
nr:hypothetical protein BaRGS_026000 [Batillaria attramentaria]